MLRTCSWMILAVSILAFGLPAEAEDLTVAIDLETAPIADLTTITSTYSGSGPTVYAFLVVTGIESVTGVLTGYSLDADSSLVNDGFTRLTPWIGADVETYGFNPAPGTGGRSSPVALGYWTLRLTNGSSSAGTLHLVAPGGVNGDAVLVLDGDHRALPALVLTHAGINTSASDPTEQISTAEFLAVPEYHVLSSIKGEAFALPAGVIGAPLEAITAIDSSLAALLADSGPIRVDKVFVEATPADSVATTVDGLEVRLPELWHIYKLTLADSTQVDPLIADLQDAQGVIYAEENARGERATLPDDERFDDQWQLLNTGQGGGTPGEDIDAAEAWLYGNGATSVRLAIVDSGIDRNHEDLDGRTISGDNGYTEDHGTMVAGTATAETNNGDGVAGVDWNCALISKIDAPSDETTAAGILSATYTHRADVINISTGFSGDSATLRNAVYTAFMYGVSLFVSMGNYPPGCEVCYPARWSELVTSVGATDWDGLVPDWSNTGSWIDVTAPGVGIWTTLPGHNYAAEDGTSFSAPCTAAEGTILIGENPDLVDVDLEQIIERTADDKGTAGFDDTYGWGRINAGTAMDYVNSRFIEHRAVASGNVYEYGHTDWYNISWFDPPGDWPDGVYRVRRYDMRADIQYIHQYQSTPDLWVRLAGTRGFSAANPHYYDWPWGMVQSQGANGATLKTFVYEVRTYPNGTPIGWWPAPPDQVTFAYTLSGVLATSGVQEGTTAARFGVTTKGANPTSGAGMAFELTTPTAGTVRVDVLDVSGRTVRRMGTHSIQAGRAELRWNGLLDDGQRAPAGLYFVRFDQPAIGQSVRRVVVLK